MRFAAHYSTSADLTPALDSVVESLRAGLGGAVPDLTLCFVSHAHGRRFGELAQRLSELTGSRVLLGCTGETVIGGSEEIESGPALSVWSASLPGTEIVPFHAEFTRTPDGVVCSGVPSLQHGAAAPSAIFCLGEPFSTSPPSLIDLLADEYPGVPLLGGMASGARSPGENRLFYQSEMRDRGAVGAILYGGPRIRSVVSQGCRPVGTPFVVTKAEENVIYALGGHPPLQRLQEMLPTLPERDQALVRRGLHLGLVMNEYQEKFERGDFLISNVIGADGDSGAIAIGNHVRVGQTVQFHVRDAQTADEDLVHLLQEAAASQTGRPRGALLFSCNGRGSRLFPAPNHDAATIQRILGPLPLAGLFAQGELGPVGGRNYIHGYTASVALFE
jgi:small ligand-binding sensory domain FIST